ncbi:MAG: hypothetical protein V3T72_00550, partial [Thermoanaerobaculia bacterium]
MRSDVHDVGIARIDADHPDMLGIVQAHPRPGITAVEATVDAIPIADVTAADVLTGADPDRLRPARIDRDATDRIGCLILEDRLPGGAGVLRFPHPAATNPDVPDVPVAGVDGDVGDAARHQGRPQAAEFKSLEGPLVQPGRDILAVLRRRQDGEQAEAEQWQPQSSHGSHISSLRSDAVLDGGILSSAAGSSPAERDHRLGALGSPASSRIVSAWGCTIRRQTAKKHPLRVIIHGGPTGMG